MKRFTLLFVSMLVAVLVVACTPAPSNVIATDSFEMKIVQVATWGELTFADSSRVNTTTPQQQKSTWLMVSIDASSKVNLISPGLGNLTSTLVLSKTDATLTDTAGQKYGLASVGIPVSTEGWHLTLMNKSPRTMVMFTQTPPSGNVFLVPNGSNMLIATQRPKDKPDVLSNPSLLADPISSKWYVGLRKQGTADKQALFNLLFEVPKGATEFSLQVLNSPLTKLSQPIVGTPPQKTDTTSGQFGMLSYNPTYSEVCNYWKDLVPCQ